MKASSIVCGSFAATASLLNISFSFFYTYPRTQPGTFLLNVNTLLIFLFAGLGCLACYIVIKSQYLMAAGLYFVCAFPNILYLNPLSGILFLAAAVITVLLPFFIDSTNVADYKMITILAVVISSIIIVFYSYFGSISGIFEDEKIFGHYLWLDFIGNILQILSGLCFIGIVLGSISCILGKARRKLAEVFIIIAAFLSALTIAGIVSSFIFIISFKLMRAPHSISSDTMEHGN